MILQLQKMCGSRQCFSPLFLKNEVLLSPSLNTKDCLLTSVYRPVFRVSPVACDGKAWLQSMCSVSVFWKSLCNQRVCFTGFVCEEAAQKSVSASSWQRLWEEGRVGRQMEYLSDGEKVMGGRKACRWRRLPDCRFTLCLGALRNGCF